MPTSTDLVTDLPADFEVFGQAVDTSLADLKGGTTGQVLAKASNTNMDFSWVAIDPLVILDAKGDLITATAADTPARLGVGTNGQVLTADSTAATGLVWAAAGSGKVKQVVSATTTTLTVINTTTMTDTTITATITPTSNTSKILVIISSQVVHYRTSGASSIGARVLRGATTISDFGGDGWCGVFATATGSSLSGGVFNNAYNYLDSPATTSATTYKMQGRLETTASGSTSEWQSGSKPSTITLIEIGA